MTEETCLARRMSGKLREVYPADGIISCGIVSESNFDVLSITRDDNGNSYIACIVDAGASF